VITIKIEKPLGIAIDADNQILYWADNSFDIIRRADLGGLIDTVVVEDLLTNLPAPNSIAIDREEGKIYWTDSTDSVGTINRADLDGNNGENIFANLDSPRGLALDTEQGKVFWTTRGTNNIQSAHLDGTEREELVTDLEFPQGVALNSDDSKMYWADSRSQKIFRANMDGSIVEYIVEGLDFPVGIAIDSVNKKLYWTDNNAGKIQRSNFNGTEVEDVVTELDSPYGLALDVPREHIYWTDHEIGAIQRANFDGTNIEDLVGGLVLPNSIVLVLRYNLTVEKTGSGSGIVTASEGVLNCGEECSDDYDKNKVVSLSALPDSNSFLNGWTNCDDVVNDRCTITMNSDKNIKVLFKKIMGLMTVRKGLIMHKKNRESKDKVRLIVTDLNGLRKAVKDLDDVLFRLIISTEKGVPLYTTTISGDLFTSNSNDTKLKYRDNSLEKLNILILPQKEKIIVKIRRTNISNISEPDKIERIKVDIKIGDETYRSQTEWKLKEKPEKLIRFKLSQ
jgi:sugar lactone lactonase YvrE